MTSKYKARIWSDVLDIVSGKNQRNVETENGDFPIYGSGGIIGYANDFLCEAGTTIVGRKGTINNPIFVRERFWNVDTAFGLTPKEGLSPEYLFYFCRLFNFKELDKSTTIPSLAKRDLLSILMPVPDHLEEQVKIVTRIEELFSELDKGVDTLLTIKQQLEVYRQAVLKDAFEGRLTLRWRVENPEISVIDDFNKIRLHQTIFKDTSGDANDLDLNLPKSWLNVRVGEVFEVEVGSTPSRKVSSYWGGRINWVSSGEVRFNKITKTNDHITEDGLSNSSTSVHPAGTILLAMIGEGKTRGQAAILDIEAAHNQNTAAILVTKTQCQPQYLYYFLLLNYENTRRVGSGNNQKALNKERVRALRFPFTSFAEQSQIVQEIEFRLSVCDNIKQIIEAALEQSESMRKSILKQAFEGRLI